MLPQPHNSDLSDSAAPRCSPDTRLRAGRSPQTAKPRFRGQPSKAPRLELRHRLGGTKRTLPRVVSHRACYASPTVRVLLSSESTFVRSAHRAATANRLGVNINDRPETFLPIIAEYDGAIISDKAHYALLGVASHVVNWEAWIINSLPLAARVRFYHP